MAVNAATRRSNGGDDGARIKSRLRRDLEKVATGIAGDSGRTAAIDDGGGLAARWGAGTAYNLLGWPLNVRACITSESWGCRSVQWRVGDIDTYQGHHIRPLRCASSCKAFNEGMMARPWRPDELSFISLVSHRAARRVHICPALSLLISNILCYAQCPISGTLLCHNFNPGKRSSLSAEVKALVWRDRLGPVQSSDVPAGEDCWRRTEVCNQAMDTLYF